MRASDFRFVLEEGFIRVKGKGGKERLVPISGRAVRELENWFLCRNLIHIKPGNEDFVFLSLRRGASLSRITIFIGSRNWQSRPGFKKR